MHLGVDKVLLMSSPLIAFKVAILVDMEYRGIAFHNDVCKRERDYVEAQLEVRQQSSLTYSFLYRRWRRRLML